jgi:branched-chain amino acid transport system substrate-binding protein
MMLVSLRKKLLQVHNLILLVCLAASALGKDQARPIKVGEINPMTGAIGQYGVTCHQGIKLAVDEANRNGGVLDRSIDLITEDNQSQPGQTATIARKLLTQDKVQVIIGDLTSSATLEAAPLAQAARIPLVTPTATNPKVTEVGEYIFRICFIDEFQGKVMARFARETLHAERAAILTDVKQDYSLGLSQFFKETFAAAGGTIVKEQSYASGDKDFRAQLSSVRVAKPDVIFLPGYYPEVSLILREARQLGITGTFVGCEAWDNPTLLQIGGKAAEGAFFSNHFSADDPAPVVQDFAKVYEQTFGSRPDTFAALGYDAARLVVDAFRRAGTDDPAKVRDALAQTRDFAGVTGSISIDEHRNASKPAVILAIKEGRFQYFQKVNPN